MLVRALNFNGHKVKHVMNFTDLGHLTDDADEGEDKLEKAARAEGKSPLDIARFYERSFFEDMKALNDRLRSIESEADRLMLELYRDIYAGRFEGQQMFLIKEFFEILEKAIDRCREAGLVAYQIVLKNS